MKRGSAVIGMWVLVLGGCATSGGGAKVSGTASAAQQAALFDRVKSLQGTWISKDDKGQEHTASTFAVSSNGSIVREVMLPGSDHEMTNVYHMDGPTLVMTHYCAMGNQPRMRATAGNPNVIDMKFDSVTNLRSADEGYMGSMRLTFIDANHIKTDWTSYQDGKAQSPMHFELWRKQ
jgi:hypothetical protein